MNTKDINNPGIYAIIISTIMGEKIYIGSTNRTMKRRRVEHISKLRAGKHHNKRLQFLWNKYHSLEFRVLEVCENIELIGIRENYHICCVPKSSLLNFGPAMPSAMQGKHHSEESKEKIRRAHRGKKYKPMSAEGREHIRIAVLKRPPRSNETRARLSQSLMGHPVSQKSRETFIRNNVVNVSGEDKRIRSLKWQKAGSIAAANMSEEKRRERTIKSWETRRRNQEEKRRKNNE